MRASNHLPDFDTSLFHPSSRRLRRLFFRHLSDFPSSVQHRVWGALDRSGSCDRALAVKRGKRMLGFLARQYGSTQLTQGSRHSRNASQHSCSDCLVRSSSNRSDHVHRQARQTVDAPAASRGQYRQVGHATFRPSAVSHRVRTGSQSPRRSQRRCIFHDGQEASHSRLAWPGSRRCNARASLRCRRCHDDTIVATLRGDVLGVWAHCARASIGFTADLRAPSSVAKNARSTSFCDAASRPGSARAHASCSISASVMIMKDDIGAQPISRYGPPAWSARRVCFWCERRGVERLRPTKHEKAAGAIRAAFLVSRPVALTTVVPTQ